jgi:hypothetical protein
VVYLPSISHVKGAVKEIQFLCLGQHKYIGLDGMQYG